MSAFYRNNSSNYSDSFQIIKNLEKITASKSENKTEIIELENLTIILSQKKSRSHWLKLSGKFAERMGCFYA